MVIQLQNFYKDTLKKDVTSTGATKFYLTLAKPTVVPGIVVISPNSPSLREIIKYTATGTDSIGDYLEVTDAGHRGLGGTTAREHKYLEPVRGNITKEHLESLLDTPTISNPTFTGEVTVPEPTQPDHAVSKQFAESLANAGASDAQTTGKGINRLSTAPGTTIGTATMTIATPGVFTKASHGLTVNDMVKFTTDGALPTGIIANTVYYVIATDLTTDTFKLATTQGGSAINTSGSQSGTHTLIKVTPTAVSDTDPRLPTQAENDAMAGTSGNAVSDTNKFVDDDDTSTTPIADRVVRLNGDGKLNTTLFQAENTNAVSLLAEEVISALTPVSANAYQADGGVLYDSKAISTYLVGSGGGTTTLSLTIGSNNNRVLVVLVRQTNFGGGTPSLTWGGQNLTLVTSLNGSSSSEKLLAFVLFAPNTGVNTIIMSCPNNGQSWNGSMSAYSLYNANQSAVDCFASGYNGGGSPSATPTQVADGVFFITGMFSGSGSTPTCINANDNTQDIAITGGSTKFVTGTSGAILLGNTGVFTTNANCQHIITVGIAPITAPTYGYVRKAGSASANNSSQQNRYTPYIGFATTASSAPGDSIKVQFSGYVSGFTNLRLGKVYYLNDTNGTYGITAGTNSKKIGIAISNTIMLLQNTI